MQSPDFGTHSTHQPTTQPNHQSRPLADFRIAFHLIDKSYPDLDDASYDRLRKRVFQHINNLRASFPNLNEVKGMRILDVACGSKCYVDNARGKYDPWMSRLLVFLGAKPVGLDTADQRGEDFKPLKVDLTNPDALQGLESDSFDAYYICAFPTRKAIKHLVEKGLEWPAMRENILSHLNRALKPGGVVIKQFTPADEALVADTLKNLSPPAETPAPTMPPPYLRPMWRHYEDDEL